MEPSKGGCGFAVEVFTVWVETMTWLMSVGSKLHARHDSKSFGISSNPPWHHSDILNLSDKEIKASATQLIIGRAGIGTRVD